MRTLLLICLLAAPALAQPKLALPDEAAGLDGIVRALIAAFDQVDIVALGEAHGAFAIDSDLRIALVRHPDFARKVRTIVVEFGSTTEQSTLDSYIRGENISRAQLEQVWKTTTQARFSGAWDSPIYADFLTAVREVNSKLPPDARVRVLGGDPGPGDNRSRETAAVALLKQALQKQGKALVIYGAAHFYRAMPGDYLASMGQDTGIVNKLEVDYPGRTLSVIPLGRLNPPPGLTGDIEPDFQKFDRALKTQARPVILSLQRSPFRDFRAEEFLARTLIGCRGPGGCASVFKGSSLKLGQIGDAAVYVGGGR